MTRTRIAPAAALVAALIGTAAAADRPVAPSPRPVPTAIAPLPHHDLRGYVPVAQAVAADPKLLKNQTPAAAGFLGIVVRADSANRPIVEAVERDSPADSAGLMSGDIITKIDNTTVTSDVEIRDLLRSRLAGDTLNLGVIRDGHSLRLSATLIPTTQPKSIGPRAVMGINVIDPMAKGTGAKVDAITPNMPADKGGVKVGDVITKVDGRDVGNPDGFREIMATRRPGDTIELILEREGKREGARVTLVPEGGFGGGRGWDDRLAGYWLKPSYKLAILGVEYPDVKHNPKIKDSDWEDSMFSIGTYHGKSATGEAAHGSMNDYYKELSHGQFKIDGKFIGWVEAKKKRLEYSTGSGTDTGEKLSLLNEALDRYLDKHGKDSLKGYDGIFFLYAGGRVQTTRGGLYWPHRANVNHKTLGRLPYFIVQEGGNRMTDISVFCHEFGHMLGLPDLYARPELPGSEGAWVWCAMSNQQPNGKPQHFCAWSKEMLGWVKPKVIDPRIPQKIVLAPVEDDPTQCIKVVVRTDNSEYFLLENRARKGFDESLPAGGLLIWRVVNNRPVLEESHGVEGAAGPRSFLDEVPYPSKANNAFTPYTTPSSKSQLGGGLPVYITNIRRLPGDRISFQIGYEFQ
jgi:immune inhibitor A